MSDLPKRLRASLRCDAINGDSFERSVCAKQMREAADTLERADARIAQLESDREEGITCNARLSSELGKRDARIAELERECSQWRLELRIYRETESKRIAELEQDVTELQRIKQAAELVLRWDWSDNDDDCLDDMRELSKAIDKARAGNGVGCERRNKPKRDGSGLCRRGTIAARCP